MIGIRILENAILFQTAGLLSLLILLVTANLYLHVSRKRTFLSKGIHAASIFGGIALFCRLMETIILDLPFESFYRSITLISEILCGAVFLIVFVIYIVNRGKAAEMLISPDLSTVFSAIEDTAAIYDFNGNLIEVNRQGDEAAAAFLKTCGTMEELKSYLLSHTLKSQHELLMSGLNDSQSLHQFEIHLEDRNDDYLVTVSPVMADRRNCIGSVLVFHDIKEEKQLIAEIENQNRELQAANKKLTDYVKIADVLESEKERLRILQSVQNDLISKIEAIVSSVKKIQNTQFLMPEDYQNSIAAVSKQLREAYREIRESIQSISGMKVGANDDKSNGCR